MGTSSLKLRTVIQHEMISWGARASAAGSGQGSPEQGVRLLQLGTGQGEAGS